MKRDTGVGIQAKGMEKLVLVDWSFVIKNLGFT